VVAARVRQTCRAQLVARKAFLDRLAGERGPAERKPEAILAADVLAERAAREVVARSRARLRLPQVALVEARCGIEEREQALRSAPALVFLRRPLLVLEPNVEAISEPFDRAREVELLRLADERDHVALRAAAEAVVELVSWIDREARRAFFVKWTSPRVTRAGLLQRRPRGDDRDDVGGSLDLFDGRVLDPRHYPAIRSAYSRANRSVIPETNVTIASGSAARAASSSTISRTVRLARSCSLRACGPR